MNSKLLLSNKPFCHDMDKLKMGGRRGRPKKLVKSVKNPFDLNLGKKLLKGGCKKIHRNGVIAKKSGKVAVKKANVGLLEAERIVDLALELGLEFPKGKDESIQAMAKELEVGEI